MSIEWKYNGRGKLVTESRGHIMRGETPTGRVAAFGELTLGTDRAFFLTWKDLLLYA